VVNPQTVNVGIIVPLTGADVDIWGSADVNPNMVAIDGFIGGIQNIAITAGTPITLTAPAGFTATPTPGPTQSQNRVLRFTGALTANTRVTLPLPGMYVIDHATTSNSGVLSFQGATATEVIGVPPGSRSLIFNDGANVRFVNNDQPSKIEMLAGLVATPGWMVACTVRPFLLCDGSIYNVSDYPVLGSILGSSFGGNGVTTFGVPDIRGRFPLAYDGTGTRVTVGGCGINGQTFGAALDAQTVTLLTSQMPTHFHSAGIFDPTHFHLQTNAGTSGNTGGGGPFGSNFSATNTNAAATGVRVNSSNGIDTTYSAGGGGAHINMTNAQVIGSWFIKT
jgi:microcystin-dependent protein